MSDIPAPIPIKIEDEMRQSYLDYAMSVIIGRALPDIRDGLKPVHRRVLYAMYDLGNTAGRPYKKSARVVGDTIGKYHPHGESAAYDALVRMAQDFSMRAPLVDGQGNFGSLDGDPPAAMRYTEVRMEPLAMELLNDLDKETVDFTPTYDDSSVEPVVLPARFPNLLVNGSSGIAVGMATNIPPHNLGEIIDALIRVARAPATTLAELMEIVPGPDFPTGGIILDDGGILSAFSTGRGILQVRGRAAVESMPRADRQRIVITEIPYQVNKARMVEKIAELVREKRIEGVSDLRDESSREGIRVVLDLRRDVIPEVVLNQLYKHTPLQTSFGVNVVAIVDGGPRTLGIRETLDRFLAFRREVLTRRFTFELRKAEDRAHILEGLRIAIANLDEVIRIIRTSGSTDEAQTALETRFSLSERQARAILDMRLARLTALEREKLDHEYAEVMKEIGRLREILGSDALLLDEVVKELEEVRESYAEPRRTEIVRGESNIDIEDLIQVEDMVVTVSHEGYIKRNPLTLYRQQRRGGKGVTGMETREEDFVENLFVASTHDYVLLFTNQGRAFWLKVHQIPEAGRAARGKAVVNLIRLEAGEKVVGFLTTSEFRDDRFVVLATREGKVKKTPLSSFSNARNNGVIALGVQDGDEMIAAVLSDGQNDVMLATRDGLSIRFREEEVRPMGRTAAGVRGIELREGDQVVAMELVREGQNVLTVTQLGYGKRTPVSDYPVQGRAGKGVITIKTQGRNGPVVGARLVADDDEVMLIANSGKVIRTPVAGISAMGRNTQGVRLIDLSESERVVDVARLAEREERVVTEPG
ncbi:MAG: DNA gyrase subunit A [bacterium]